MLEQVGLILASQSPKSHFSYAIHVSLWMDWERQLEIPYMSSRPVCWMQGSSFHLALMDIELHIVFASSLCIIASMRALMLEFNTNNLNKKTTKSTLTNPYQVLFFCLQVLLSMWLHLQRGFIVHGCIIKHKFLLITMATHDQPPSCIYVNMQMHQGKTITIGVRLEMTSLSWFTKGMRANICFSIHITAQFSHRITHKQTSLIKGLHVWV